MSAPVGAFMLKNALLTFAATDYANQVRVATLTPDQASSQYKTLVPDGVVNEVDTPTWTLALTGLQINLATGFANYLRTNAGNTVAVVLEPQLGGESATFSVVLKAVPFGGEQGTFAEIDLELPCTQPLFELPV